jgi:hypothetical protein
MDSWLMLTWLNININTISVNCSLPRDVVSLTQLTTSVQSSSHSFPWCWRIQSRAAKKAPAIETKHQVTTDIIGPLFSFGLLTQVSIEDIWSGFGLMWDKVQVLCPKRLLMYMQISANCYPFPDPAWWGCGAELTPRTKAKAKRSQ